MKINKKDIDQCFIMFVPEFIWLEVTVVAARLANVVYVSVPMNDVEATEMSVCTGELSC